MNNQNLKPFQKGVSGNPNGRPKKLINELMNYGYKKSEIINTIYNSISCTEDELNEFRKNKDLTILEKTVIEALLKSASSGDIHIINDVLKISESYGGVHWNL